jgi:hypothetical protein
MNESIDPTVRNITHRDADVAEGCEKYFALPDQIFSLSLWERARVRAVVREC